MLIAFEDGTVATHNGSTGLRKLWVNSMCNTKKYVYCSDYARNTIVGVYFYPGEIFEMVRSYGYIEDWDTQRKRWIRWAPDTFNCFLHGKRRVISETTFIRRAQKGWPKKLMYGIKSDPLLIKAAPKPRKVIINGHAQHGKDYLAGAVAREFGMKLLNASMFFAETVLMPAFPGKWACVEDCYNDRVNYRALWYQMMRIGDWQQQFIKHSDIYCGHRNIEEHQEMRASGEFLCIWVSWDGKAPEDASSSEWQDQALIEAEHDLIVRHNGDGFRHMLEAIRRKLK